MNETTKNYLTSQFAKLHNENLQIKIFSFCEEKEDKKETNFLTITERQKAEILNLLLKDESFRSKALEIKELANQMFLEYLNNYISREFMAEHLGLSDKALNLILELGKLEIKEFENPKDK